MAFLKPLAGAAALSVAMLIGVCLSALPAQAAYTDTMDQVGGNVVATGSGSLDISGLSFSFNAIDSAFVAGSRGSVVLGPTPSLSQLTEYNGISGPTSFGSGGRKNPNSGSGSIVGIEGFGLNNLVVPNGYTSGRSLGTSTDTWDGATFSSLGVTPGTYVWRWGSGADADSFTLQINTPLAVPEPASLALLGGGLLGLLTVRRRRC